MRYVTFTALGTPVAGLFFIIENLSLPYLYFIAFSMVISKFSLPGESGKRCYSEGNFAFFSLFLSIRTMLVVCLLSLCVSSFIHFYSCGHLC